MKKEGAGKKILVVDDKEDSRVLVGKVLRLRGYKVIGAATGEEAINMAQTELPDLILMDIMMPNMDGYQACSIIKTDQSTKRIPVVMLTGLGYELNKKLAKEVGASGYITKPFTQKELLDTIGRFLEIPK